MIYLLAQGTAEGIGIGAGSALVLGLVGLFVKRGITGTFKIGDGGQPVDDRRICGQHEATMQLLGERKVTADDDRAAIKDSIKSLRDEQHTGFTIVFDKIDRVHEVINRNQNCPPSKS